MIERIISGGQTGADQAALRAAKKEGIATGGWAPKGWRTHAGPAPWLADYGLVESPFPQYSVRTLSNVKDADATLIIGMPSPGTNLTQRFCGPAFANKPWLWLKWPEPVDYNPYDRARLFLHHYRHINVAGNREEMNPGIGAWVEQLLEDAFIPF